MSSLSAGFVADCGCYIECQPSPCSTTWDKVHGRMLISCVCEPPCRVDVKFYPCKLKRPAEPAEPAEPRDNTKTPNSSTEHQFRPNEQRNKGTIFAAKPVFNKARPNNQRDLSPTAGPSRSPDRRNAFARASGVRSNEEIFDDWRAAWDYISKQKGRAHQKPPNHPKQEEESEDSEASQSSSSENERRRSHDRKKSQHKGKEMR